MLLNQNSNHRRLMKQWKVITAGLLVLSAASVALAEDMKTKSGAWYLNTGYGNTGIIRDADKDFLLPKLGKHVFTVNLGREVFRDKNLTLSLEGGINHHPEDKRCGPSIPFADSDYATPAVEICSLTSAYAIRLGVVATMPLDKLDLTFGLGVGQYFGKHTWKIPGEGNLESDLSNLSLDFVAGVDWNLFEQFAVGAEVRHFQYREIEPATAIGINAKFRF